MYTVVTVGVQIRVVGALAGLIPVSGDLSGKFRVVSAVRWPVYWA